MNLSFDEKKHIYTNENGVVIPSVTQILKATGLFSIYNNKDKEFHMSRGTAVHKACELEDENDLDETTIPDIVIPYLNAWRDFKKDMDPKFLEIEKMVWSEKHGFAGTLDRLLKINQKRRNEIWLVDIKSGVPGEGTDLQTVAYQIALEEMEKIKVTKRVAVQLKPDGSFQIHRYEKRSDKLEFLTGFNFYKLLKKRGKVA